MPNNQHNFQQSFVLQKIGTRTYVLDFFVQHLEEVDLTRRYFTMSKEESVDDGEKFGKDLRI